MAPGPIRGLRYIHEAIRAQAGIVEERAAALGAGGDAEGLTDEVALLTGAVRGHAAGEDAGYFPTLAERAPGVTDSFQFDHEHEEPRLAELERLAGACDTDADRAALYRTAVSTREHLDVHMLKEEQLLWPLTEELFSPPEQGGIIQAILAAIPKKDFPALIPWIVERNTDDDAVAYVQLLQRVQPPEVFSMSISWIKGGVSPARWQLIADRMPELA